MIVYGKKNCEKALTSGEKYRRLTQIIRGSESDDIHANWMLIFYSYSYG